MAWEWNEEKKQGEFFFFIFKTLFTNTHFLTFPCVTGLLPLACWRARRRLTRACRKEASSALSPAESLIFSGRSGWESPVHFRWLKWRVGGYEDWKRRSEGRSVSLLIICVMWGFLGGWWITLSKIRQQDGDGALSTVLSFPADWPITRQDWTGFQQADTNVMQLCVSAPTLICKYVNL